MKRKMYANPFRFNVSSARIDAGVDYCGTGPVHAIGPGRILQVGVPSHNSTFGEKLSSYVITAGPLKGLVVYFAEHYNIQRGFKRGDRVDKRKQLYKMNGCIEIGFGTDDGLNSYAWHLTNYQEGQLSRVGKSFSELMVALGAPAGSVGGRKETGPLPPKFDHNWRQELDGWVKDV